MRVHTVRSRPRTRRVLAGLLAAAALGLPAAAGAAAPRVPATPARPPLLPALADAPRPLAAAVAAALAPALADPTVAGHLGVSVVDARTGEVLVDQRAGEAYLPASTTKLVTAAAALTALDPTARLVTRVTAGPQPGDVVLVGGGDVTLAGPAAGAGYPAVARVTDLAAQVLAARAGAPVTRVLVDDTAYGGPATAPGWRPTYVPSGQVAPVSALAVDEGRRSPGADARVPDPAVAAGAALAAALGVGAVPVARGTAPAGAAQLAAVASPPVPDLVELMLTRSDNDLAEALAHRVALATGRPGSFAGAAEAVRAVLDQAVPGVAPALADGSGLSRDDRLRPAGLTALLAHVVADRSGRLAPLLSGLPVGGFDGTLADRYRAGPALPAAGQVRAKTGTLDAVSALSGVVRTADGRLLAFALLADAVPLGATRAAEAALDRAAAALAGCGCR